MPTTIVLTACEITTWSIAHISMCGAGLLLVGAHPPSRRGRRPNQLCILGTPNSYTQLRQHRRSVRTLSCAMPFVSSPTRQRGAGLGPLAVRPLATARAMSMATRLAGTGGTAHDMIADINKRMRHGGATVTDNSTTVRRGKWR